MINQAPIVRYTASVSEIFFPDFRRKTFSAEYLKSSLSPATFPLCIRTDSASLFQDLLGYYLGRAVVAVGWAVSTTAGAIPVRFQTPSLKYYRSWQ